MTIMVATALFGGLAGVLAGGRVRNIAHLRIRAWWLLLIALLIQATLSLVPLWGRIPLLLVSSAVLVLWCLVNLKAGRILPGMVALTLGIIANTVVIAWNGGMPVSRWALVEAGYIRNYNVTRGHLDKHVAPLHAHLAFLGDFLPIPGLKNILSPGDVVMLIGIFLVVRGATFATPPPMDLSRADQPEPDQATQAATS